MNRSGLNRIIFLIMLIFASVSLSALELTVIGPPKTVLHMWDGSEAVIDPTGSYVFYGLNQGDVVMFTTEIAGYMPADYAIEMGGLSKTFRISPDPTGVIAGELKFTDSALCPGFGVELYFNPEDAYLSFDFYQSFIGLIPLFNGAPEELSTKYIMPMLGSGFYLLPSDSFVRFNLGSSAGCMFGSDLPHPLFAAEFSAGVEFRFLDHYILFAEMNPRLLMCVEGGWDNYRDIFGSAREPFLSDLGSWALSVFPSTWFGIKYKY